MINEAEGLNQVIMTTGGWGLAAFLFILLILLSNRYAKVMDRRVDEHGKVMQKVTEALIQSSNAMIDLRDEIRRK